METKPAWMAGLDMTRSRALSALVHMSQADLDARNARIARENAENHARKEAARAARAANAFRADLIASIRAALSEIA